ncbi:hypothetical protein ACFQEU_17855, partial [Halorubrum tibetense]
SHDRHLLRNTVEEFWLVHQGRVEIFDGDLDAYHQWAQITLQTSLSTRAQQANEDSDLKIDRKVQRQQAAAQREKLKPLTQKLKKVEQEMEKLQARLTDVETLMGDADLYLSENKEKMQKLLKEQGELKSTLENAELQWLEISEALEQASV